MKKSQENKDDKILKQNYEILNKLISVKQKRHVKEPTELVFKNISADFLNNYGKTVVAKTTKEIMKFIKDAV